MTRRQLSALKINLRPVSRHQYLPKPPVANFLIWSRVLLRFQPSCAAQRAETYPSRPVRIIVGFPPGGAADITARVMGQWLSERLGQPFVIENRPGAGTNIGTETVAKSPADGYTLLLVSVANTVNATLYKRLNFDFIGDIAPVAELIRGPLVMELHPSVPANTVLEFIAYAKANPGRINVASAGNGTPGHMASELFQLMTGLDLVDVPYRGGAPALTDLLAGQVQVIFDNLPTSLEYIRTGKVRPLASDHSDSVRCVAGLADGERIRAGLRGQLLVWRWRTQEHSHRDSRQAQYGDQRWVSPIPR